MGDIYSSVTYKPVSGPAVNEKVVFQVFLMIFQSLSFETVLILHFSLSLCPIKRFHAYDVAERGRHIHPFTAADWSVSDRQASLCKSTTL